ncbi:MAG: cysteine desulfurase family protein [Bacteroidetes bacterium]|nr:cysteine desulfurase family protein [Bacteroidota bacterium]
MVRSAHPQYHAHERRKDFPALSRTIGTTPLVYLDGPAGTQVPRSVIDAIVRYYETSNANTHGQFLTTRETDALISEARSTVAAFLGAGSPSLVSFGANMTTLAFSLSRALVRSFRPGDEVLITQLDHEANRGPWLAMREHGIIVREIPVKADAAMGWASNAFGTVNDVALARRLTYRVGALLLVDAVHYAPHFPIDVSAAGVDFLLCSAYKFYGPHVGILTCRDNLLDSLVADRLRTQDAVAPHRIETGTQNHAAIAGVTAAIEYIASLGQGETLRARIVSAMGMVGRHERALGQRLHAGLSAIAAVTVQGPPFTKTRRAPTVSFTVDGKRPEDVCAALGEKGICAWDGHFYAIRPVEILGLLERGGVTRVGVSLYTTDEDIDRLLHAVRAIARSR